MPFTVMLLPTTASESSAVVEQRMRMAVARDATASGSDGTFRTADGGAFSFDGSDFRLTTLSPGICRLVFDAAAASNSYVDTGGDDATPLAVRGVKGQTPDDLPKARRFADSKALCAALRQRLRSWNRIVREGQLDGMMGPEGQPLSPPADPGAEPRLKGTLSGVAADCQRAVESEFKSTNWKLGPVVVSQNPTWGVVWRADVTIDNVPEPDTRYLCWRHAGPHPGLVISSQPLTMFDPDKSVAPLKVEP